MSDEVKSGQQMLDEFFSELAEAKEVDKEIADIVIKLYGEGKLTNTNLSNEFAGILEEKLNVEG